MKMLRKVFIASGLFALSAAAYAEDHRYQTSDVIDITGAASFYQGAAWLVRSQEEVEGRIMTKVSTAGDPYTLWAVIFNNPDECAGTPCVESDLFNPDVGGSVFYASSAISSADGGLKTNGKPAGGGVINFDFELEGGSLPDGWFVLAGDPNGLAEDNGYGAEIHLVVDKHPPVPGGMSWIPDLTTTNFPGAGPATNDRAAIFLACTSAPCPGSVFQ
jgi:hypothetical protein